MKPVSLQPLVTVHIEESPFDKTDLHEFPWQARYKSITSAYEREMYAIQVEDEPVGAMLIHLNGTPELVFFEVEPRWRGKGVGQASLEILFEQLRRKSLDTLVVQTGRPEIYSGMGFKFSCLLFLCHIKLRNVTRLMNFVNIIVRFRTAGNICWREYPFRRAPSRS